MNVFAHQFCQGSVDEPVTVQEGKTIKRARNYEGSIMTSFQRVRCMAEMLLGLIPDVKMVEGQIFSKFFFDSLV